MQVGAAAAGASRAPEEPNHTFQGEMMRMRQLKGRFERTAQIKYVKVFHSMWIFSDTAGTSTFYPLNPKDQQDSSDCYMRVENVVL